MSFEAQDNTDEVMNEINMTPLVDVMLVLLIIFIITMPMIHHAVKVELPRTSAARDPAQADSLQLSVDAQGHILLAGQEVAAEGLEAALNEHARHQPQPQLMILGDKGARYEHVALAMAAAQRAGIGRIGFVLEASQR